MFYTFYSFKGGVGRSMALANVAQMLCARGLTVLAVDFDLEAPGLERFFWESVPDSVMEQRGVVDLVRSYKALRALPAAARNEFPFAAEPLKNFIAVVREDPDSDGTLYLMPAGQRPKDDYAEFSERVRTFDWDDFYRNWNDEQFFDWFRAEAGTIADVVLVDSRTGITEMSGICTYHLADCVVMFVASNQQNLHGTLLLANSLQKRSARRQAHSDPRPAILIVPSRIEPSESPSLAKFKKQFNKKFLPFKPPQLRFVHSQFDDLKIPYIPHYAYFEKVAVCEPDQPVAKELIAAYERLVAAMVELAPRQSRFFRRYYRQTAKLSVLSPQAYAPEAPLHFVERSWVLRALDAWLEAPSPAVFLVMGSPGSGKSALAYRLVQISQGDTEKEPLNEPFTRIGAGMLAYAHFCQAANVRTLDALTFIKFLALVLADRFSPFAQLLAQTSDPAVIVGVEQRIGVAEGGVQIGDIQVRGVKEHEADQPAPARPGEESARTSRKGQRRKAPLATQTQAVAAQADTVQTSFEVQKVFAILVLEPLRQLYAQGFSGTIVILIDGLDEALSYAARDNLVDLATQAVRQLPPQVRFIVTARPDPRVLAAFREKTVVDLGSAAGDIQDLRAYTLQRLPMLPNGLRHRPADQVVNASAGNFLYAKLALDALEASSSAADRFDPASLLPGLEELYREFMHREVGSDAQRWAERDATLLGVLCIAFEGLTLAQLAGILKRSASEIATILQPWMRYLHAELPEGPFRIYHPSFGSFLLTNKEYPLQQAKAHQAIADFFVEEYSGAWERCRDEYPLRYAPKHLLKALELSSGGTTRQELENKLIGLLTDNSFLNTKTDRVGIEAVAEDLENAPASPGILRNLGVTYQYFGNLSKAMDMYRQGLEMVQKSEDRAAEGVFIGHLGSAYAASGDFGRAIEYYRKALTITRDVADRRSESHHLVNLGYAYQASGEPHRAIECYQQALAITRATGERYGEGRILAHLGDIHHALEEPRRAIESYERALAIADGCGSFRTAL